MNIGAKEISLKKLQKDAEDNFRNGYYCCEALVAAVRKRPNRVKMIRPLCSKTDLFLPRGKIS